ncbi:unnamed protein product [Mytilus coruscus]|uniref:Uncharacterized protein n=1 Tax=Mytilus coruscus TaxID=42192 RepID=A0A6J8CFN9_MYTCO|nr:unnamed protein product [Mytilus coruscus]
MLQELLSYQRNEAICQNSKKKLIEQGMDERKINPYKLGKTIFYLHHQIDLKSKLHVSFIGRITDVVMMDDGRLVICLCTMHRLLICNTDGLQVAIIPVKRRPCHLTPVNNTMVAVLLNKSFVSRRIEIYDINNKHKLQSIPINREGAFWDNTVIVVSTSSSLVIDDYQTEELVEFVETHCNQSLRKIHFSGDRIFYRDKDQSKHNLHWYSFTNNKLYTVTLPSIPFKMTTIQDGSLYVLCKDRSVQHISSNGKHFKSLKTNQSQGFSDCDRILYNSKQKKMFTLNISTGIAKILHEL